MSKSNKNKSHRDDPVKDEEAFIVGNNNALNKSENFADIKNQIEKKAESLSVQLDSEQRALQDLSENLSKRFSEDFARFNGELQTLLLNVSDLNVSKDAEQVQKEIEEFTGQLNNLHSQIIELSKKIADATDKTDAEILPSTPDAEQKVDEFKPPESSGEIMPQDKLRQLIALLEKTDNEDMQRWAESLRVGLPEEVNEDYSLKGKRKIASVDKSFLPKVLDQVKKEVEFTVANRSADRIAAIKQAAGEGENKDVYLDMASILGIKEKDSNLMSEVAMNELRALRREGDELYGNAVNFVRTIEKGKNEDPVLYSTYIEKAHLLVGTIESLSKSLDKIDTDKKFEKIKQATGEKVASYKKEFIELKNNYDRRVVPDEKKDVQVIEDKKEYVGKRPGSDEEPNEPRELIVEQEEAFESAKTEEPESEAEKAIGDILNMEAERVVKETEVAKPVEEAVVEIMAETEGVEEIRANNERIEDLTQKLIDARNKLTEAFIAKEKAAGVVGRFKKMFKKGEARGAEDEVFDTAWNEYADLQKEVIEATRAQAEHLRSFLGDQSKLLQEKIGAYYKGKENVVAKVWKRLGDMNLYNFLEKKGVEVKKKEEGDEMIGTWDRFWANRAKELQGSNALYKIGAKALSVRLGLSIGLMSAGVFGVTGAAEARGAMVGIGTAFGSRHMEDALQNKLQRRFGNRGEFYGSSEEAEAALRDKYYLAAVASGETEEDTDDKKAEKRRKKMEKELGLAEKNLIEFESLPIEQQIAKIQEKIASVEAFSYVNGVDLSKDVNYQRLIAARDQVTQEYLSIKAIEAGDERPVVRPDNLQDAMAFLESRKTELSRTAEKISSEKLTRWGKRLIATAAGVASGTYAYFATLSRAELYAGHKPSVAAFAAHEAMPPAGAPSEEVIMPEQMMQAEPDVVMEGEMIRAATPAELAKINQFMDTAGENQGAIQEFQQYLGAGHSSENISNALLVHKGDGIERVLQRQLLLDPQAHGFEGDINDLGEIRKWAGHEASVITQKQGLADKYFIYDAKNPQYLVLHDDGNVDIVGQGKLHHVSEIAAAKAREAAEKAADMVKTPEGEVVPVREVIDIKTGQSDIFTDVEQAEYQILVNKGEYDDAMDLMMKAKARGPIYEMPDGTEVHRADIADWEGDAPLLKVSSGAEITHNYYGNVNVLAAESPNHNATYPQEIGFIKSEELAFYKNNPEIVINETKDYIEALNQTHPDSAEYRSIINTLKHRFEILKMSKLDEYGIDRAAEWNKLPETLFGKDIVEKVNEHRGYIKEVVQPSVEKAAEAKFQVWQEVQALKASDYLNSLKNNPAQYEAYKADLLSKGYTITSATGTGKDIVFAPPAEAGYVSPAQPLEVGTPSGEIKPGEISYEEAYRKPLSEMTADDIFEQAEREMEKINKGFTDFYTKDAPISSRMDSLKDIIKPGEVVEQNTIQYSLSGEKIIYKVGNVRGVLDSAEEANLLSDMSKLVRDKSQEIALTDGPARKEMQRIVAELAEINKKVI